MRLVILLFAMAIVGLLAVRQLGGPADAPTTADGAPPQVPTQVQELDGFERDMDRFVEESGAARREAIEEQAR